MYKLCLQDSLRVGKKNYFAPEFAISLAFCYKFFTLFLKLVDIPACAVIYAFCVN